MTLLTPDQDGPATRGYKLFMHHVHRPVCCRPLLLTLSLGLGLLGCQNNPASNADSSEGSSTQSSGAPNAAANGDAAGGGGAYDPRDTTAPGPPPPGGKEVKVPFDPVQMQQAVRNFADLYRQTVAAACDRIIVEAEDDPDLRRRAQQAKINGATALYDIAVDPVPASAMLNSAVVVTLQTNFLKNHGEEYFGEFAPQLLDRAEFLQEEAFKICARAMTGQQRTDLLNMANQWSQANPDVREFWYVRLNDLPGVQAGVTVTGLINDFTDLPMVFLNKLNPFASTGESVTEAQALAERMSWLGPRLMILAQWRAEAVVYDSIANTRLPEALELGDRFATVAESLPETLNQQRTALFKDLAKNKDLLTETSLLTANAAQLFATVDSIGQRVETIQAAALKASENDPPPDPDAPPSRPFDINEYTAALTELNQVVNDANTLLTNADSATSSQALDARLDTVADTVTRLIVIAAIAVLAVGLLIVLAVKFIPGRRRQA